MHILLVVLWVLQALIPLPREMKVINPDNVTPKGKIVNTHAAGLPSEGYLLTIDAKNIRIEAADARGAVWAEQTLRQLQSPDGSYPQVEIRDWPEFPIRGFMYDSGRNFVSVQWIKDYIELISRYKLNVFHWHLTDKPAWRIECKVFPELNQPQYQRIGRDEGRFYTYDQIREVIAFAAERGVMVIPEIDMPGHSDYFVSTFDCTMDSEKGRFILEKCLTEFFEEIPASLCPFLHIGSDEVHIADPAGFMKWAEDFVHAAGRQTMAWDPGLPGSERTVYQIWKNGTKASDIAPNKKYVDSYQGYLNYFDPLILSNRLYLHDPCSTGQSSEWALGAILCLWNDVRVIEKKNLLSHNGVVSGLLPFAERIWRGGRQEGVEDVNLLPSPQSPASLALKEFQQRMKAQRDGYLERLGLHMFWTPATWQEWELTFSSAPEKHITGWGNVLDLDALAQMNTVQWNDTTQCSAQTRMYASKDTVIWAWVGFDMAARSNRISDGIPRQGEWPNNGRLEVNGQQIAPPVWEQPGLYRYHFNTWGRPEEEQPFTDEQFYWLRKPMPIELKQGWNHIAIKVDRTFAGQRFEFAFLPLD